MVQSLPGPPPALPHQMYFQNLSLQRGRYQDLDFFVSQVTTSQSAAVFWSPPRASHLHHHPRSHTPGCSPAIPNSASPVYYPSYSKSRCCDCRPRLFATPAGCNDLPNPSLRSPSRSRNGSQNDVRDIRSGAAARARCFRVRSPAERRLRRGGLRRALRAPRSSSPWLLGLGLASRRDRGLLRT